MSAGVRPTRGKYYVVVTSKGAMWMDTLASTAMESRVKAARLYGGYIPGWGYCKKSMGARVVKVDVVPHGWACVDP